MKYVLDSSVALKWLLHEPDSDKAIQLREDARNGVHELLAPDIFPTEVLNSLTTSPGGPSAVSAASAGLAAADHVTAGPIRIYWITPGGFDHDRAIVAPGTRPHRRTAGGPGIFRRLQPGRQRRQPVIVRRNGEDLAAVIPLEYLALLREVVARQEAETQAAHIDWSRAGKTLRPLQQWFNDTDNPFDPDQVPTP
jgi:hypothetical protein